MLYLIGIGLKPSHLTIEAKEALQKCDEIYLEEYTSQYSQGHLDELKQIIEKEFKVINRIETEESLPEKLMIAKDKNIALMIFGNALTATTHIQFLLDAKEKGIKIKIIPGISITNYIAESGLDEYKFGRTVTICYQLDNFKPESFYHQIKENQKNGLHTLCLLDIKKDQSPTRLMNCKEAIEIINEIEKRHNEENNFNYIGLVCMGSDNQKIIIGKEKIINSCEVEKLYPQTLIISGKINEKEKECLENLYN
ncbi:MAG: diphthine synthase [Candidatus ainarchaeum sp.]|nr:diphthine synthase [Candidatus ainarchaeum sp.]